MTYSAATLYKNSAVQTASPAELTLMLYEGAIKFCNIAIVAIEKKDYEKTNTNIQKAQRIIAELRATLNFKYDVAKDFDNVYEYIYERLVEANMKKSVDVLEDTLEHIRGIRDTWKEVMRTAKIKIG